MNTIPLSIAGPAIPLATVNAGVFGVVRVALGTVRPANLCRRQCLAPEDIFSARHGFQMRGVDAMADAAEVIEREPVWDGSHEHLVSVSMSQNRPSGKAKRSVAVAIGARGPEPTRAEFGTGVRDRAKPVDLGPETLSGSNESCRTEANPSSVVHYAPAPRTRFALAAINRTGRMNLHRVTSGVMGPGASHVAASLYFTRNPTEGRIMDGDGP